VRVVSLPDTSCDFPTDFPADARLEFVISVWRTMRLTKSNEGNVPFDYPVA
jgi:hypothetical protein